MDAEELFRANLPLIERVIARAAQRAGLTAADADDFASEAKLMLLENDYAVLRSFEGRSSLAAFVTVIVSNCVYDRRAQAYGRWRTSAEAQRLGPRAVQLETLIRRDRRSLDQAETILRAADPSVTRAELEAIAARLPERAARARLVALEPEVAEAAPSAERADARLEQQEQQRAAERVNSAVRRELLRMSVEDRMIVRLRFFSGMTIADVSRILRLPQRPLYRRIERLMAQFRDGLTAAGIDGASVEELIGGARHDFDFRLDEEETSAPAAVLEEKQTR